MSETSKSRDVLSKYCVGIGLDIGCGGDKVVPEAWGFDMVVPYTKVGSDVQQLRGSCKDLSFICDSSLDYIYSAHLLEDFSYQDLEGILKEWRRVLNDGGLIITNCPDQQRFLAHCSATGQSINDNHYEPSFSLDSFKRVLFCVGDWEVVEEVAEHGPYSWLLVVRKKLA